MGQLSAGASKECITLPEDLMPYPVPDWFGGGTYTGVKDDIFVRCLALSDGKKKALIICAELGTYINAELIQDRIYKECGIPFENIMISATHTHEVPEGKVNPDIKEGEEKELTEKEKKIQKIADSYNQFIADQTVLAAKRAVENMEPARYGYGEGKSYINCNRDEFLESGVSVQGLNFERPSDKTLGVILFESLSGRKIGVLINYAVHNDLCFHQKDINGEDLLVYGDISAEISKFVEKRYAKDGMTAVWTNGAAGNQNPYLSGSYNKYNPDGSVEENYYKLGGDAFMLCEYLGQRQGLDVVRVMNNIKEMSAAARITTAYQKYELPGTRVVGFTREMIANPNLTDYDKIYNEPAGSVPLGLMLITFGDIALYGINGEVMCETGLRIKEQSSLKHTWIISYMGDNPAGKYLADQWGYEHRTFAYYRNTVENGRAEECMLQNLKKMLEKRFEE